MDELLEELDLKKVNYLSDYQILIVSKALECHIDNSEFDKLGLMITGENKDVGFIYQTGSKFERSQNCWDAIKSEVYKCFCTESEVYADIKDKAGKSFPALVSALSAHIATIFSIGAGVVVGAVAIAVIAVLRIGKNAWCNLNKNE